MAARLRVVIIGAGPAGLYAADALTFDARHGVQVDLIDRLPTPFGLLRNGVAPDHFKIKSLEKVMQRIIERPAVRFLGNITLGKDVTRGELLDRYDAIIYAYGAPIDRRLHIAGEDLPCSISASDFVAWYNGHPERSVDSSCLVASKVAIIGVGNVALDMARMLLISRDKLRVTDIASRALRHLTIHRPADVYIVGRRSAAQAKFTPKELRELGDLEDVDIVVDPGELAIGDFEARVLAEQPNSALNLETLRTWAQKPLKKAPHRLHFRFLLQPERIEGNSRVEAICLQRMKGDGTGSVCGTGRYIEIGVGAVIRSIGYTGQSLQDIPFDPKSGTVPNLHGRLISQDGAAAHEFVTGWARRGSTGVIGSNRSDATEVAESILATMTPAARSDSRSDLVELVAARGVPFVTAAGWSLIDLMERELGKEQGRPRVKLENATEMLNVCRTTSIEPGPLVRPAAQKEILE
jgi:ferredoxin--NADP+ reductase